MVQKDGVLLYYNMHNFFLEKEDLESTIYNFNSIWCEYEHERWYFYNKAVRNFKVSRSRESKINKINWMSFYFSDSVF